MADDKTKPPFTNCPACGTPQIADAHALTLYFPSIEDCREVAVEIKKILPHSFKAYTTDGEV